MKIIIILQVLELLSCPSIDLFTAESFTVLEPYKSSHRRNVWSNKFGLYLIHYLLLPVVKQIYTDIALFHTRSHFLTQTILFHYVV